MLTWLARKWRKSQRSLDLRMLWPICCEQAQDLDRARAAFMWHCMHDPAWTSDFTEREIVAIVGAMA